MRIGIDIDGVLTDIERFIIEYGIKFCIENNLTYHISQGYYDENKVLGISKENTEKFWNKYLKYYATKYPIRDHSAEIIKKLREDGHEIYLITARNELGLVGEDNGKMKDFVNKWLKDNKIEYDKIIYTEENKVPYIVGNYIDIIIEDNPQNIKSISNKIPVLCYHNSYNADVQGKDITRVYSWYDIYNKISNM